MKFTDNALLAGRILEESIVQHSNFDEVSNAILQLIAIGKGTGLFTGARLIAPSGTGKTSLVHHIRECLLEDHPDNGRFALISASLKENPSVSQIQTELLANFKYPLSGIPKRANNNDVNHILVTAIAEHKTRLVALDEFQHVFHSGGTQTSTVVIDWVKRFMNITKVPVLLLGTEMLDRLQGIDPQLTTRIPTVLRLSAFQYDDEWVGFIKSLGELEDLPLDLSTLHQTHHHSLFRATQGNPRMLKNLLVHAVVIAITEGHSRIDDKTLAKAYRFQQGTVPDEENPFVLS